MIQKVPINKNLAAQMKQFAKTQEKAKEEPPKERPVRDTRLPDAIIVDIDGTLALRGDRGVYDFNKCEIDVLYEEVKLVVDAIQQANGDKIKTIICSGREDFFKEPTERWLAKQKVAYDMIFMRRGGDHRNDTIVKKEIYDANIKGKYNVILVIDDRKRIVDMWRQEGLVCLQVAEGNF